MKKIYIKHPKTVTGLGNEVKKICDDYYNQEIELKEITSLLVFYKNNESEKLLKDNDINPTVQLIAGKKRISLVKKIIGLEV